MKQHFLDFDINAEFLYTSMVATCNDYIYVWDVERDAALISPNMAEDFGIEQRVIGNFFEWFSACIHVRDRERVTTLIKEAEDSGDSHFAMEFQVRVADGSYLWVRNSGCAQRDTETKKLQLMFGMFRSMEQNEYIDHVTGLPKYERCRDKFEKLQEVSPNFSAQFLLFGIDEFATINTLNNHNFGDMVLRTTAQDIAGMLPEGASLYRFEGDQFLVTGKAFSSEAMHSLYNRIQVYGALPHKLDGQLYRFTVSAGMISYPQEGSNWSDLEKGASVALKKAKENGKNQCVEFTQELLNERLHDQVLSHHLSEGVNANFKGFRAVFQPVCFADSLEVKGAEALMRFRGEDGRDISPVEFIPLLETSQLILPVGMWMLEQAIKVCKEWTAYIPHFVMNVNVSYVQLRDPSFCEKVEYLLEKYKLDVKNLTIELTESFFISGDATINATLKRLKRLDISLAMDDFGTGYSSLGRLAQFNVDVVKIDRIFVQALHKSQYNHDFVESVIRLCHNVGMQVCVEGVETREEQESVYLLDTDFVQGYYVSKPLEKSDFYHKFIEAPYDSENIAVKLDKEKIQKQLVGDKDLLNAMTNATPLCLALWDSDFEMVACNDEAVQLFEATSQKDLLEHFFDFSPLQQPSGECSKNAVQERLKVALVSGRTHFPWVHCTRDGENIPVEVVAVRLPYHDGFIVATYTRDLREQVAAEEEGQRFRLRLKALLDATPLCLNLWTTDFRNVMCNQVAVDLFDLNNEQEYLDRFFELSPEYQPDGQLSSEAASKRIVEAIETGRSQFAWTHQKLDGTKIPAEITLVRIEGLDDDGSNMVAGYTRDLSEQVAAEERSEKFHGRLNALLDATPLCVNLWNTNLENIMCNYEAVTLFELENKQEYLDRFECLSPEYQPDGQLSSEASAKRIIQALETGRVQFSWMHQKTTGEPIPAEITLVRIDDLDDSGGDMVAGYTRDLRSQLLLEQAQHTTALRIRAVMEASPLACLLWSMQGEILDCNQVTVDLFGASTRADVAKNFDNFNPLYQPDGSVSLVKKAERFKEVEKAGRIVFEWLYLTRENEDIPCEVTVVRVAIEGGEDIIVSYNRDLRELRKTLELNERLTRIANYDALTGCLSRSCLFEKLESLFKVTSEQDLLSFIYLDLDAFKEVNDTYGHEAGDIVLKEVVNVVTTRLPSQALFGRFGGDEFIIALQGLSCEEVQRMMDDITQSVASLTLRYGEMGFATSVSLGAAFRDETDRRAKDLLRRADAALYEAKRRGRNCGFIAS